MPQRYDCTVDDLPGYVELGDVWSYEMCIRDSQYMMFFTEFGVGVADRTNGTARYVNNAVWADGTPS